MNLVKFAVTTIDQNIADFFNSNFGLGGDWSWGNLILCAIAIILTTVLCGIIGYEREKRGRSAGLRTHLLVGLGSCVIMIISIYGFSASNDGHRDVARLAAGVITGVGFLGAGTIIHNNGSIKGLTTASTVWLSMAIGLACGSMNFLLAVTVVVVSLFVLIFLSKFEKGIVKDHVYFSVLAQNDVPIIREILQIASELNCSIDIDSTQIIKKNENNYIEVVFSVKTFKDHPVDLNLFKNKLYETNKVVSCEILNQH